MAALNAWTVAKQIDAPKAPRHGVVLNLFCGYKTFYHAGAAKSVTVKKVSHREKRTKQTKDKRVSAKDGIVSTKEGKDGLEVTLTMTTGWEHVLLGADPTCSCAVLVVVVVAVT